MPINEIAGEVAVGFPKRQLGLQGIHVSNSSVEALAGHDAQFDFGDVEPASMLWRVMDFEAPGQCQSDLGRKGFIQRGNGVGVEIIHHKADFLRVRVVDFQQLADLHSPVLLGSAF